MPRDGGRGRAQWRSGARWRGLNTPSEAGIDDASASSPFDAARADATEDEDGAH
jgi:hypothetical protein